MPFAAQYLWDYRQGKSNVWTAYKAVWDSVKFYNENGYIPCCYSNVKFVFCGKEPIPLDLKYFQQKKRFAEFNIKLLDEGAELLPNTMRTNNGFKDPLNVNDINNYLSMFRQYDSMIYCEFTKIKVERELRKELKLYMTIGVLLGSLIVKQVKCCGVRSRFI